MIHDWFGRDQHEILIHQMFHIKQVGSVAKCVDQFLSLVDQLAAYESDANPLYYAMHFIDGLRDDIKPVVMIQHPSTLDSACVLTLVQEKVLDWGRRKETKRYESIINRMVHRPTNSLIVPPKLDKPSGGVLADDRCNTEAARAHMADDKL
jgi:hypothetical protein